jgi:hypothetical protein
MSLVCNTQRDRTPDGATLAVTGDGDWPLEIRALLGALSKPSAAAVRDRRAKPRNHFRALATLWIMQKKCPVAAIPVYLRDYAAGAVSFVGQSCFTGEQRVELETRLPDGTLRRVPCTVSRCRQFREGWFEGVLKVQK